MPLYNADGNLFIQNNMGYNTYLCEEMTGVCYVGKKTKRVMRGLAWALLALYAFTFALLIMWSCLCWKKYRHG